MHGSKMCSLKKTVMQKLEESCSEGPTAGRRETHPYRLLCDLNMDTAAWINCFISAKKTKTEHLCACKRRERKRKPTVTVD